MDDYASYFIRKIETICHNLSQLLLPSPSCYPETYPYPRKPPFFLFREQAIFQSVKSWLFVLLSLLLRISSEIVCCPSLLNFNSFLSIAFSPSACKHDKDLTPNLLFQSFSPSSFQSFLEGASQGLSACPVPFLLQPTISLCQHSVEIALNKQLGNLLFFRSNGKFTVFILLTTFLNPCETFCLIGFQDNTLSWSFLTLCFLIT